VYSAFWEKNPQYINQSREAQTLEALSGDWGVARGDKGSDFAIQAPLSPLAKEKESKNVENSDLYQKDEFSISKESIFYYIYALLNHPTYKEKYKDNLSKMLPRIPFMKDFWGFEKVGRALANLHLNYEGFKSETAFGILKSNRKDSLKTGLFSDKIKEEAAQDLASLSDEYFRISKLRFEIKGKLDTIIFNDKIAIVNIPLKAHDYKINGRSAIEWIMDRYQVKIDKDSNITNDPNLYESENGALKGLKGGRYVLALLLSVIEMSVRTMNILENMPKYEVIETVNSH